MEQVPLFIEAERLGIHAPENDLMKLLEAIRDREIELISFKHKVQRRIAGILERAKA